MRFVIHFFFRRTFNDPPVAFAGNLANDGSILVLYDELFKVKMRQRDQLFGRGVAFSGFSRE